MGTAMGIVMTDPLLTLAQWLSPAFPVGSFAYSHGLEQAIAAGEVADAGALRNWLQGVLCHDTGRNDAILLVQAHAVADDPGALAGLAELAEALAPSAERHAETIAQGRAFAETVEAVWALGLAAMPYPVAVGAAAGRMGLPARDAASLYLHAFATGLTQAAVRFMPMGQTEGQQVLLALHPVIASVAAEALVAGPDDVGGAAWLADIAAMRHETMPVRIFRT